ncbi:MAG: 30S ribosomal protein S19e [Candidatus Marsarchaeota archaeon]|jgi:small subunit ribosomal protein S19e|nr:30S ribosomal protein S19e [Candidatus Marsarchaeota archaeon]
MANVLEVDSSMLIQKAAEKLAEAKVSKPQYVDFVKSGAGKERTPQDQMFWYIRCASVLRQAYVNGPIGISRLRTRYGTRKKHSVRRHHHMRAGGSIIKDAFDGLEKLGYVKKTKKGRAITQAGRSFLDKVANEVLKTDGA